MITIAVKNLLQLIQCIDIVCTCGCENQLHLLSVIPNAIANKADVSGEFCGGKTDDGFQKLIRKSYDPRYTSSVYIMIKTGIIKLLYML